MRPLALCCLAILATPAVASEHTDLPEELQGTLDLTYSGATEFGNLIENDIVVGKRRMLRNDLDWNIEFSPIEGAALVIGISQTPSIKYAYPDARPMLFEPVSGGGTYLLSEEAIGDETTGGGVNGVWIGAAFSPYNERYDRGQKSTWRLDLAFRTGSPNKNLWVAKDGKRGSAPGGSALKIRGAVSTDMGVGNPWADVVMIKENGFTADLVDENGNTWIKGAEISPASELEVRAGVEVVGLHDLDKQTRFAVDFFMGFGYHTPETVASGVYLPNVLDGGKTIQMVVGDYTYALVGIAADYHINENVRARTGPEFTFHTPWVPEHAYDVVTGPRHIGVGWMFRIEGLYQPERNDLMDDTIEEVKGGVESLD